MKRKFEVEFVVEGSVIVSSVDIATAIFQACADTGYDRASIVKVSELCFISDCNSVATHITYPSNNQKDFAACCAAHVRDSFTDAENHIIKKMEEHK